MDEFDLKMLRALQQDGRLTNQELADLIGLSPSQCSRRRVTLEKAGVITGYHAAVSNAAVGLNVLVFIQVSLATQAPDSGQAFAKLIRGVDEVQECYSLTGEADYLVKLVVPNLEALSRVINDVFLPHRSVGRVQSSVVLDRVKETARLPLQRPSQSDRKAGARPPGPSSRKTRPRS
jgi:DNA-binding Lrp family transcriptional regulator